MKSPTGIVSLLSAPSSAPMRPCRPATSLIASRRRDIPSSSGRGATHRRTSHYAVGSGIEVLAFFSTTLNGRSTLLVTPSRDVGAKSAGHNGIRAETQIDEVAAAQDDEPLYEKRVDAYGCLTDDPIAAIGAGDRAEADHNGEQQRFPIQNGSAGKDQR